MAITRRALLASSGLISLATALELADPAYAAARSTTASTSATTTAMGRGSLPAAPLTHVSRNSTWTRSGPGPLYWNIYGWSFPHNAPIPEDEWKANIDWLASDFAPSGYEMACTDGWIEGSSRTTEHGYITSYNDSWTHDWAYWAAYLAAREMTLGVYYNPLWVHRAAVEDPTKTVAGRPDVKIADIVAENDFMARDIGGNTLYWVDVTKPGAREYVQGYVEYFKKIGVPFLRIDFLSWYENGMDANIGRVNAAHGRDNYVTALHWINEAAGDAMEVSLVMPHLFDNAAAELANGDMVRINADADKGGWERLSGGRQDWQNAWPNWFNPFCGFTGWSHRNGRGQLILDGDFLRIHTFANDEERKTAVTLMTIAGSPIAIADLYSDIGSGGWVFTQPEVLHLHKQGLVGKPLYHSGTPYSVDPTSRDTERWAGQLPDGSWVVALFNRGDTATVDKSLHFSRDLGIAGSAKVRDVWARRDLGLRTEARASLAPHACALFHVTPQRGVSRFHAAWAAWGGGANFNNNHPGYGGSGFVDKLEAGGEPGDALVTFAVQAPRTGTYSVRWRYANGLSSSSTMTVSSERADGSVVDGPHKVTFPSTTSWDSWDDRSGKLRLRAGLNLVTIGRGASDVGAINLNWLELRLG